MNETPTFTKHTGKETKVEIIQETKINSGSYGDIFDTVVKVGSKERRLVVKKYKEDISPESAIRWAKKAFKIYSVLKNAKLKVFPTFRIDEKGKNILMTTGLTEDQILRSGNDARTIEYSRPPIVDIENFNTFLVEIFSECVKAAEIGIELKQDVFFFIVNRVEPSKIDFILGDFDNVKIESKDETIKAENLKRVFRAIFYFIIRNVSKKDSRELLLAKLYNSYEEETLRVLGTRIRPQDEK